MIFKGIRKIWANLAPRKRVVSSWAKIAFRSLLNRFPDRRKSRQLYLKGLVYFYFLFILAAPFSQAKLVHAPILPPKVEARVDLRVVRLKSFLDKYESPLTPYAGKFIAVADKYDLDWRLLPAIAGTESTFGLHYIRGTYNPFGWGSGRIPFASWSNGIEAVGKGLWKNYYLKGKRKLTVEQVGDIYAVSPHWPRSVRLWMGRLSSHQLSAAK